MSSSSKGPCYNKTCKEPATKYCGVCRYACYCSIECQREDWSTHKTFCKPNEKKKIKDMRLLHKCDRDHIVNMVAWGITINEHRINTFRAALIVIENDILEQSYDEEDLRKNCSLQLMKEEGFLLFLSHMGYPIHSFLDFDPRDKSLFFFITKYNGYGAVFSRSVEEMQEIIDSMKEFQENEDGSLLD